MSAFEPIRPTQKTYSHLLHQKRMPSEYDLITSDLLYYVKKGGFETKLPLQSWYDRYQKGSRLQCPDLDERFKDPRETTYTKYTARQAARETFVDGILQSIEDTQYDAQLPREWIAQLDRLWAPLRYPWHGLQMAAAYVGQMAPSGRVAIAALFQAADEMRRIQRVAYRMRQLQFVDSGFGARSREIWENDSIWQPLRETTERLLVTYDWGEAFAALNLCLKPLLDELFLVQFAGLAKMRGDYLLGEICFSLAEDCRGQREWTAALVQVLIEGEPKNRVTLMEWVAHWLPYVERSLAGLATAFEGLPDPVSVILRNHRLELDRLGLRGWA